MITVIMANYNGEKFIIEAIQSVITQNFDSYEFIIIDDASEDSSQEIIADFHQQHPAKIKPIYLDNNQGQAEAFNIGIQEAKGELICFLDSDDLWFPSKLQNVSNCYTGHKENVAFYQHNLFLMQECELTNKKYHPALITGDYFKFTIERSFWPIFVPTSGLSFPRHILNKVLPIPKIFKTCADGYLTRTCFTFGEVHSINDCWGAYRVHANNHTFHNPNFCQRQYIRMLIEQLQLGYKKNNRRIPFHWHLRGLPFYRYISLLTPPIVLALINKIDLWIRPSKARDGES